MEIQRLTIFDFLNENVIENNQDSFDHTRLKEFGMKIYNELIEKGYKIYGGFEFKGFEHNPGTSLKMFGQAHWNVRTNTCKVIINRLLVKEREVKTTILHELAHLFAGPHEKHGNNWKRIARELGKLYNIKGVDERVSNKELSVPTGGCRVVYKLTDYGRQIQRSARFKDPELKLEKVFKNKSSYQKYINRYNRIIEVLEVNKV